MQRDYSQSITGTSGYIAALLSVLVDIETRAANYETAMARKDVCFNFSEGALNV
jgi:hypothetical protein